MLFGGSDFVIDRVVVNQSVKYVRRVYFMRAINQQRGKPPMWFQLCHKPSLCAQSS